MFSKGVKRVYTYSINQQSTKEQAKLLASSRCCSCCYSAIATSEGTANVLHRRGNFIKAGSVSNDNLSLGLVTVSA